MPTIPTPAVVQLPTERTRPKPAVEASKTLLYGRPKIGKSTVGRDVAGPERTIFLATEEGQDELEVFTVSIGSWEAFRGAVEAIRTQQNPYTTIVVDTIDGLCRMCVDFVVRTLGGSAGQQVDKNYVHLSDFGYGKGYGATTDEFMLRIGGLCQLGRGVIFVSHEKRFTQKTRAGELEVATPDVSPGGLKNWLEGFVDYIFYADMLDVDGTPQRVLHTQPSDAYLAGGRVKQGLPPLPDPIPLTGNALRAALEVSRGQRPQTTGQAPNGAQAAQNPPQGG